MATRGGGGNVTFVANQFNANYFSPSRIIGFFFFSILSGTPAAMHWFYYAARFLRGTHFPQEILLRPSTSGMFSGSEFRPIGARSEVVFFDFGRVHFSLLQWEMLAELWPESYFVDLSSRTVYKPSYTSNLPDFFFFSVFLFTKY